MRKVRAGGLLEPPQIRRATGLLVSSITPWKPRVNLWVIAVVVAMAARAARDRRRRITADVAIEVRDDNIVDRLHRTAKHDWLLSCAPMVTMAQGVDAILETAAARWRR